MDPTAEWMVRDRITAELDPVVPITIISTQLIEGVYNLKLVNFGVVLH